MGASTVAPYNAYKMLIENMRENFEQEFLLPGGDGSGDGKRYGHTALDGDGH